MKLITIYTDGDFSISYKGKNLTQYNQTIYILVKGEQDFIDSVYNLSLEITLKYTNLLYSMADNGEGSYGNYSYNIEEYVPFIHELKE